MMSSPGAGKTALLERTLERERSGRLRIGVLEGDVQTTLDADRLARFHVPIVQVNTTPASAASATSTRTWSAPASPSCRWRR
jgi:hydrogenase nickel incorporation protein HypB